MKLQDKCDRRPKLVGFSELGSRNLTQRRVGSRLNKEESKSIMTYKLGDEGSSKRCGLLDKIHEQVL